MTGRRASRKDAVILSGVNASKPCLFGLLLLAAACRGEAPPRPDQALVESVSESPAAARSERDPAVLTRIDVYGVSGEEAAGARVVLLFQGAPLFRQRQLPAKGILPDRIAIELEDATWGATVPVSQPVGRGGLRRVRLATPNPRVVLDLEPGAAGRVFYLTDPYRIVNGHCKCNGAVLAGC